MMEYNILRLKSVEEINNTLIEFSQYMFIPLDGRNIACEEYANKLFQHAEVYTVEIGAERAGMIAFYCNDFKEFNAYLTSIVVKAIYRKNGVASHLLQMMFDRCRESRMHTITLEVHPDNLVAISFYCKYGFKILDNATKTAVYMKKFLNNGFE